MKRDIVKLGGHSVVVIGEQLFAYPALANDLIALAWENDARVVAVRVDDLPEDAFALRSGLLGEMAQKFANYRLQLVIVGDVADYQADSKSFRDYVYETNQGDTLWFLPDMATLESRLG
ncbi:DUF4180 domain-containing protein [Pelagibacterium mangrovi]|uniref:DUF4180 domain-containing protein n=1 Tax=Pelagibacterium mangrovi TaxID=3119828 RepID=UPI002FC77CDF